MEKPKFSLVKWGALGLGVLLGVSHFSMIGLLSNRKTLPKINLPVGPYTAYEVEASHDGYRISYRANDPKVMTVQKDIKTKGGFLGLGKYNIEGKTSADWKLIDAIDIIVHIFHPEKRKFYDLEKMWCDPTEINEAIT